MTATVTQANMTTFRAHRAVRIRKLMQSMTHNSIQLGLELKAAQETFTDISKYGERIGWKKWLKNEIGFSTNYAGVLIRIGEKFKTLNTQEHGVSFRVLRELSADNVPEKGKKEVLRRARKGEKIGRNKAKKIIDKHRPAPKLANKIARETGKPTLASDGYVYLGGTKEEVKQSTERRTLVYAVRRAIDTLSTVEVSPTQLIAIALPHQLWNRKEEKQIDNALRWLAALKAAWGMRK